MVTSHQVDLTPITSALGNVRQLFEQVLPTDDGAVDPELFERLSRAAAELAELERDRRRKRRERAVALFRKVSELFPEMANAENEPVFVRFGDKLLDHAATTIERAIEANDRLAESDARLRAAIDEQNYGTAQDLAARALEHQAEIAAQKERLASLLAPPLEPNGSRGAYLNLADRLAPQPEAGFGSNHHISVRLERQHEPQEVQPQASFAVVEPIELAAKPDPAPARAPEPSPAPAAALNGDHPSTARSRERISRPDVAIPHLVLAPVDTRQEHDAAETRRPQRETEAAEAQGTALVVLGPARRAEAKTGEPPQLADRIQLLRGRLERTEREAAGWQLLLGRWRRPRSAANSAEE